MCWGPSLSQGEPARAERVGTVWGPGDSQCEQAGLQRGERGSACSLHPGEKRCSIRTCVPGERDPRVLECLHARCRGLGGMPRSSPVLKKEPTVTLEGQRG